MPASVPVTNSPAERDPGCRLRVRTDSGSGERHLLQWWAAGGMPAPFSLCPSRTGDALARPASLPGETA